MTSRPTGGGSAGRGQDAGSTLVELSIVVLLSSLLAVGTLSILLSSTRSSRVVTDTVARADQSRIAVERLSQEIRQARGLLPLPSGSSAASHIRLWNDVNADGTLAPAEDVSYSFVAAADGVDLHRWTVADPARRLHARGLAAGSGFGYDLPPSTATATVTITVQVAAGSDSNAAPVTISTAVRMRNTG